MNDAPAITGRPPTEAEQAISQWATQQSLASLDTLEAAARTILSLITVLLGTLFGVLTVAAKDLPAYMQLFWVRRLGCISVVALLAALTSAMIVLLPGRIQISRHRLDEHAQAFENLLRRKSRWLTVTVVAFGVGVDTLGIVLILAILNTT
jgi:hypothetical protein